MRARSVGDGAGAGALLIDFGSTFTKVRAVDLTCGRLVGAAQAPSTVTTNVMAGLQRALDLLRPGLPQRFLDNAVRIASSSAAGGLRIVALGLVEDLTTEAAKRAALGAGGKVVATFASVLSRTEVRELEELLPDIVVLSGGTDGGDRTCITENARLLADSALECPVIVAGNRKSVDDVRDLLARAGKRFVVVPNVMPTIERLDTRACSEAIRDIFMRHIVESKGLRDAEAYVGRIVMPTPQAVLKGCDLLTHGPPNADGLGPLVCVDIGGATTDVYSVAPAGAADGVVLRGLPEPTAKRTVEGDLGLRINASSIVEVAGLGSVAGASDDGLNAVELASRLSAHPDTLPASARLREFDAMLARAAARVAVRRHAGTLEVGYGPQGRFFVQRGKDLRRIGMFVGTGGIFQASSVAAVESILSAGCYDRRSGEHLVPEAPRLAVDREYVLYAVGLLSERDPEAAYRLGLESISWVSSDRVSFPASKH